MLIAIEGIDGSGKGTQAKRLTENLSRTGRRVALLSFPRYDDTFFGRAVGRFLNGEFGSLAQANPFLVSLLFAGDRFESRALLQRELEQNDVVVLDRYVASNIAHQGAKLPIEHRLELIRFVEELEFNVYNLPRADRNILLDLPVATAQTLIGEKHARSYTDKSHDLQEADANYLEAVRQMYLTLADQSSHWSTIVCESGGEMKPIEAIADEILQLASGR